VGGVLIANRAEEHQLNDKEFKFICTLVYDTTGIVLDERKKEMVYRRLMRRTRELKIGSFSEYCQLLSLENSHELPDFINNITTNLTSFFREIHHFEYLAETFIPQHIKEFANSRRLRIWSSACSTGEEPYSLAITLRKAMGSVINSWDTRILATDLDTEVLSKGKKGVYKTDRIKDLSPEICKRWFKNGSGDNEDNVKIDPSLADLITFKQLNLLHEWPVKGPFDVIMCRNVLIYFDKKTQKALVERFTELLRPGGLLILGHSESIAKSFGDLKLRGHTIFEKQ
jgi:chemotaxis protein methyltransferase CheR